MTQTNNSIRDGIILGLSGLVVSILLLYYAISTISQPITTLSSDMRNIANGNLGIAVKVKGDDEVGNLGKSLQKVADTLYKLLADINRTISEHEKGNIDYFLDTEEFYGDYKKLADNIVELAAFGLKDQLTSIPNRRAFDNRLEMEWNRAIRDNSPLSLLVLDVDRFKRYNDTFGHQQGDLALKAIAKTIKQTLKRPADICARWGGEEFVVLLPATDSGGAIIVAEYIRLEIENLTIPCNDPKGAKITISIGISTQIPAMDSRISVFISNADAALYKAKKAGRNRIALNENSLV